MAECNHPVPDPEGLAKAFHDTYERLAPDYGYKTREASAVDWDNVPADNRELMIATAASVARNLGLVTARIQLPTMEATGEPT